MSKEKLASLKTYIAGLKAKLDAPIPDKHKEHPNTYHEFLLSEVKKTQFKIDEAVIAGVK